MRKFNNDIYDGILFTDQYQLVMMQLYFTHGYHETEVQFDHFFRSYPDYGSHKAGYCINAGLEWFIDWLNNVHFGNEEIEFLRSQKDGKGNRIFRDDFLTWLEKDFSFDKLTITAIPEGRVVHANEPLTSVRGSLAAGQLIETALLNKLNFQTLIATKASRIKETTQGQMVLEFGARRAHDTGANAGARAALIGGADFTSNVGISHLLGYPPKGTQAHSMIQFFYAMGMSEFDAFEAFAELYPDSSTLLVDTINTLESGVPNAIRVFEKMKKKGNKPVGIRLDSGDLAYLAIRSAKMLNEAGFEDVSIVLSNELDELNIWQIITQIEHDAPKYGLDPDKLIKRLVYGVGTRLITSSGSEALGGVYKLISVKKDNAWKPVIKISDTKEKIPVPANKQIYRIYDTNNKATCDLLCLEDEEKPGNKDILARHPNDTDKKRLLKHETISQIETLHKTIFDKGKTIYNFPTIDEIRNVRINDLEKLDAGVKRLINPHKYHVSVSEKLFDLKTKLITEME